MGLGPFWQEPIQEESQHARLVAVMLRGGRAARRATEALKRKRWQPFFGVASSAGLKKLRKYTRDLLR